MLKFLIYCTKSGLLLSKDKEKNVYKLTPRGQYDYNETYLNGKIVAEVDGIYDDIFLKDGEYRTNISDEHELLRRSCLTRKELDDYLSVKNNQGKAIYLSNLKEFEFPKILNEYGYVKKTTSYSYDADCYVDDEYMAMVENAPQNMMVVYDSKGNCYVLISIRPQWVCHILNRTKDIEVRKVVIKE